VKSTFAVFFFLAFVSVLSPSASAQSGPPAICKPCLYYSGDLSPSDPSAEVFLNEETISTVADTFGAVLVPRNRAVMVEGLLFQTVIESGDKLDPKEAFYQIRTNITNNGGTLVAAGGGAVNMQPTGRQFNGNPEYTIAVRVSPPVQLSGGSKRPGTAYWFNLQPQCTNQNDPTCQTVQYFVSNSSVQVNSYNQSAGIAGSIVFVWPNYPPFSYCYDDGYTDQECVFISFGIMGKVVQ
jgi:hypothetical protein